MVERMSIPFDPHDLPNPAIQLFNTVLRGQALEREEYEPVEDLIQPSMEAWAKSKTYATWKEELIPPGYEYNPRATTPRKRPLSALGTPGSQNGQIDTSQIDWAERVANGTLKKLTIPYLKKFLKEQGIKHDRTKKADLLELVEKTVNENGHMPKKLKVGASPDPLSYAKMLSPQKTNSLSPSKSGSQYPSGDVNPFSVPAQPNTRSYFPLANQRPPNPNPNPNPKAHPNPKPNFTDNAKNSIFSNPFKQRVIASSDLTDASPRPADESFDVDNRPECKYGASCSRTHNAEHMAQYLHPAVQPSQAQARPSAKVLPKCKYGSSCYQKSADHLAKFSHPPDPVNQWSQSQASQASQPHSGALDSGPSLKRRVPSLSAPSTKPLCKYGEACTKTSEIEHNKNFYHPHLFEYDSNSE